MQKKKFILILFFFLYSIPITYSQEFSPLLPDTGYQAVIQKKVDIRGGLVVLSVTLAPGFEDLPALTYYRLKLGAKIGCVYFTNGEDIPNYEYGKIQYETAKQRKEEAYQAISMLGGEAFFINVPALVFHPQEVELLSKGYIDKLESVISDFKPDIILVNSDYLFPSGKSNRIQAIIKALEQTIQQLKKNNQWYDLKIFLQTDEPKKGDKIPVLETYSLMQKSYFDIANDINNAYKSMRKLFPIWAEFYHPNYVSTYPKSSGKIKLSKINQPSIPQRLQKINSKIKEIVKSNEPPLSISYLNCLQSVIGQIDDDINHFQKNLSLREGKLLLYWKKAIEDYRSALHNVSIQYTLLYKDVTSSQVFFVRIGHLGIWARNNKAQLMFPGVVQKEWIVDARQDYTYPLLADTSWLIVSPKYFPITAPVNEEGYQALQMRYPFTFMVVHEGLDRYDNFVYQKDIPLISVPPQSIEILTPTVVANFDTVVKVIITNNLFNSMKGEVWGEDSTVSVLPLHISLPPKSTSVENMHLKWKRNYSGGEQHISLRNKKGQSVGNIFYREMAIAMESNNSVGVITVIDHSPMVDALRRINCKVINLDTTEINTLEKKSTIIIDEQASEKIRFKSVIQNQLKEWILAGGKMIVMPQYGPHSYQFPDDSVVFKYSDAIISHKDITVDTNPKFR